MNQFINVADLINPKQEKLGDKKILNYNIIFQ